MTAPVIKCFYTRVRLIVAPSSKKAALSLTDIPSPIKEYNPVVRGSVGNVKKGELWYKSNLSKII